ncbi:MAG: glutamine synthetase, partial [Dehalococcoidia bacterium]
MDFDTAAELIDKHEIRAVKIGGADLDGVFRGKRVSAAQFLAAAEGEGFPQCDVVFGWDIRDEVIGDLPFSNWDTGFADVIMKPDLSTFAIVPWEDDTASCVCDFYTEDGDPLELSPRQV